IPSGAAAWPDLRPVLDEEIGRLPDKYRAPVVLCYLEGQTLDQTARQLGWPKGTVAGRLARAREMLRRRLSRRGVAPALLMAEPAWTHLAPESDVPVPLVVATVAAAATGTGSPAAAALADAVLRDLFQHRLATALLVAAVALALFGLIGLEARGAWADLF